MEKEIRNFITESMNSFFADQDPLFAKCSIRLKAPCYGSQVWRFRRKGNLSLYASVDFRGQTPGVFPLIQWSQTGMAPDEGAWFELRKALDAGASLADLSRLPEGWLRASDFGLRDKIGVMQPSMDRLEKAYSSKFARSRLSEFGGIQGNEWRENEGLCSWGLMKEFSGEQLTQEDLSYATAETVPALRAFFTDYGLPYLRNILTS